MKTVAVCSDSHNGTSEEDPSEHEAQQAADRPPKQQGGRLHHVNKGEMASSAVRIHKHTAKRLNGGTRHAKHRRKGGI